MSNTMETIREFKQSQDALYDELKAQDIIREITELTGISYEQMKSRSRDDKTIVARRALCFHLQRRLGMSQTKIGRIIERDHTTALFHIHRAQEIIAIYKNDPETELLRMANTLARVEKPSFSRYNSHPVSPYVYAICKHPTYTRKNP